MMTKIEKYKKNQRQAKILRILTPIVFWGLLVFSVIFFSLALTNSCGNMNEITTLLNSKKFTGEELRANYIYLTEKYGEWVIGNGSIGFTLTFIDIKNAIFGGFVVFTGISAIICLIGAFVFGKWLFPLLADRITQGNQDMVNLTILENEDEKQGDKKC